MPSFGEIRQYLLGSWRMMTGRPDGIRMLDISADGFWNSFFAIAVALPAVVAGCIAIANATEPTVVPFAARLSLVLKLAISYLGTWLVPLAVFVLAARPAGLSDKIAHYVISSNWGGALIEWLLLPLTLFRMFLPAAGEITDALSIGLSLFLTWRLTNSALAKGPGVATAVFAAMFVVSVAALYALQVMLGLGSLDPATG